MINLEQQTADETGKLSTHMAEVPIQKKDPNTGNMVDTTETKEQPITVFKLLKTALLTKDVKMSQFMQKRRYNLFHKIQGKTEVKFNYLETLLIKYVVFKTYGVNTYGQIVDILNKK